MIVSLKASEESKCEHENSDDCSFVVTNQVGTIKGYNGPHWNDQTNKYEFEITGENFYGTPENTEFFI